MEEKGKEKPETLGYFQFGEVLAYFFRRKRQKNFLNEDASGSTKFNIRAMHWVNKISIIMFLLAVIVLVIRHLF